MATNPKFKIFSSMNPKADTVKIYSRPQETKSQNLAINIGGDDELVLQPGKTLADYNITNETELSFFRWAEYVEFSSSADAQTASFGH